MKKEIVLVLSVTENVKLVQLTQQIVVHVLILPEKTLLVVSVNQDSTMSLVKTLVYHVTKAVLLAQVQGLATLVSTQPEKIQSQDALVKLGFSMKVTIHVQLATTHVLLVVVVCNAILVLMGPQEGYLLFAIVLTGFMM